METMHEARGSASASVRHAGGSALVAVEGRVAGKMPAARRTAQTTGDCVQGFSDAGAGAPLEDGAEGGIRTLDRRFTKPLLYH